MAYEFPHITHLSQVLEAIEGRDEFIVKHDEVNDLKIVNYMVNFPDSFPPVVDNLTALRRECRGITFRASTGELMARKFHKFFNINERAETQTSEIDFTERHWILEKLDGSMITPLLIGGQIHWTTKMGLTDVAEKLKPFISQNPQYDEFARYHIERGHTPLFEFCSRRQRIVLDYPEERLVLLALRYNTTGHYLEYDNLQALGEAAQIPVVRALEGTVENIQQFMADAHDIKGEEGYVVRFESGHMYKVKGSWYCQLHNTIDALTLEKDVIRLVLEEKLDDAKPFLPEDLVKAVDDFSNDLQANLMVYAERVHASVVKARELSGGDKKVLALEVIPGDEFMRQNSRFIFKAFDRKAGVDAVYADIQAHVLSQCGTGVRVEAVREMFGGIRWDDYQLTR